MQFWVNGWMIHSESISECCRSYFSHMLVMYWKVSIIVAHLWHFSWSFIFSIFRCLCTTQRRRLRIGHATCSWVTRSRFWSWGRQVGRCWNYVGRLRGVHEIIGIFPNATTQQQHTKLLSRNPSVSLDFVLPFFLVWSRRELATIKRNE